MRYRSFGKLGWQVSALGFGAMRLPIIGGDAAKIDEPRAAEMLRYAIDHGVNYVDTAYPYHRGQSEIFLGKILQGDLRKRVKLATKMPTWLIKSQDDMERCFKEQLTRLKTNFVDFYLLHGLDKEGWQKLSDLKVLEWEEKKVEEGKIGALGFSFHDDYDTFKHIVDSYDHWTLCQIQYNYSDADYQAGMKGLRYASSKGLAVVVMEPIAGGRLAIKPPKPVQDLFEQSPIKKTAAALALQWVWNQPEVSVVLSGMSAMEQVVENVETASQSFPGVLTDDELELLDRIASKYRELGFVGCTGCRYCIPCPEGVNIPEIISLYNEYYVKGRSDELESKYWEHITPESQAKRCKRCRKCEELCPQHLPVSDVLSKAAFIFESED